MISHAEQVGIVSSACTLSMLLVLSPARPLRSGRESLHVSEQDGASLATHSYGLSRILPSYRLTYSMSPGQYRYLRPGKGEYAHGATDLVLPPGSR